MDGTIHCRRWACVRAECIAVSSVNGLYGIIHRHILSAWMYMYSEARRRTVLPRANCVDVRHHTQGWHKQRKVQNMPRIWRMPYYVTNSSHVIGHFLRTLCSLRYVRCIACSWKPLNAGCQLREDGEWAKYKSNNACVGRCGSILSPTGCISRAALSAS